MPARKPLILRQRQRRIAVHRCQPEIRLHMQVFGSIRPHPRQNQFQDFGQRKPTARDGTEQSGRAIAHRSRRCSCRCNSNPMQIQRKNRQRDRPGETVNSTRTNTVKATSFEVVYREFYRRMLPSRKFEVLCFLPFLFGLAFPFAAGH